MASAALPAIRVMLMGTTRRGADGQETSSLSALPPCSRSYQEEKAGRLVRQVQSAQRRMQRARSMLSCLNEQAQKERADEAGYTCSFSKS